MSKVTKTLNRVLRGNADANIGFADLCALKMPNFKRNLLHRRRRDRQRRKELGVPVALNDLSRDGRVLQGELFADALFDFGVQMRERADRA